MTESAGRRFAWAVFGLVVLLLGGTMVASILGARASGGDATALAASGGEVVVVGAAGLTWTDLSQEGTPTLLSLVDEGASGGLIVRSAHELTCPADGWLTLSAGQRASVDTDGTQDCAAVPDVVAGEAVEGGSGDTVASIPAWNSWVAAAARRPLQAQLGSLGAAVAETGGCVRAVGPLAAVGAAASTGPATPSGPAPSAGSAAPAAEVSRYAVGGLAAYRAGECGLTLLEADEIGGPADAARLDAELATLRERLPADATLIVAGLADRDERAGVRVALVWRAGMAPGALHSTTTSQDNLVQTTDLTATVLQLLGAPVPESVSGAAVQVSTNRLPAGERLGALTDLTSATEGAKVLAVPVLGIGCVLALAALAQFVVRRRHTEIRLLGLWAMAFPSASFLAGLLPWWRADPQWVGLVASIVLIGAGHVTLAMAGPWRRHPLGPPSVVAALTVLVLGVDVILGGRLGLISILGVQPVVAGRFHGMGNVGYGIFAVSGLLLAGFLVSLLRSRPMSRRTAAAVVVGVLGVLLVLVDGAPMWGADFGGVPALVVGLGVLGLAAAEIRLTPWRALLVGGAALLAAAALMLLDWLRPEGSRTHLGDFAQAVIDGDALGIVSRKLDQSLGILVRYPISWLAVLVLVLLIWAVASPGSAPGRFLAPLWQLPLLRATAGAVLTCLVIAWALNDSGVAIVGIGLAVAIAAAIAIAAAVSAPRA